MKKIFIISFLAFYLAMGIAQQAPNFIVTDSDGLVHDLYADHLNQGQTVVIKLFFTTCPPCIALAPWMEQKYQQWGAGQYDVEFIELSTQAFDSNADVAQYKVQHGVTYPGVGNDGGGKAAAMVYQSGQFGPYFGTPTLVIIAPDGTVHMGFSYDDFDAVIASTGATGMEDDPNSSPTTTVSITNGVAGFGSLPSVKYFLKTKDAPENGIDILEVTGGQPSFQYPSALFPAIPNPVIVAKVDNASNNSGLNVLDLLRMRKHILDLEPLTDDYLLIAADVNSDNKINALDLLNLQRAILELIDEFPNNTPPWKSIPAEIPLTEDPDNIVNIGFQMVKIGNLN